MRFVKVAAVLACVAVACRAVLVVLMGRPPGVPLGRGVAEIAGGGLLIFALSVVAAAVAAYFAAGREEDLPGLKTGVIAAVAASVVLYFAG